MTDDQEYARMIATLAGLLRRAIREAELPPELLPENVDTRALDGERLRRMAAMIAANDRAGVRAYVRDGEPALGLFRGPAKDDAALDDARERVERRRRDDEDDGADDDPSRPA